MDTYLVTFKYEMYEETYRFQADGVQHALEQAASYLDESAVRFETVIHIEETP